MKIDPDLIRQKRQKYQRSKCHRNYSYSVKIVILDYIEGNSYPKSQHRKDAKTIYESKNHREFPVLKKPPRNSVMGRAPETG